MADRFAFGWLNKNQHIPQGKLTQMGTNPWFPLGNDLQKMIFKWQVFHTFLYVYRRVTMTILPIFFHFDSRFSPFQVPSGCNKNDGIGINLSPQPKSSGQIAGNEGESCLPVEPFSLVKYDSLVSMLPVPNIAPLDSTILSQIEGSYRRKFRSQTSDNMDR